MGTVMPCCLHAALNSRTIRSRSAGVASMGTRSLSWRFTPHAPTSASMATMSLGGTVGRTASPNGSRPRLPTVHKPNENLCSGRGSYLSFDMIPPKIVCGSGNHLTTDVAQRRINAPIQLVLLIHEGARFGVGLDLLRDA